MLNDQYEVIRYSKSWDQKFFFTIIQFIAFFSWWGKKKLLLQLVQSPPADLKKKFEHLSRNKKRLRDRENVNILRNLGEDPPARHGRPKPRKSSSPQKARRSAQPSNQSLPSNGSRRAKEIRRPFVRKGSAPHCVLAEERSRNCCLSFWDKDIQISGRTFKNYMQKMFIFLNIIFQKSSSLNLSKGPPSVMSCFFSKNWQLRLLNWKILVVYFFIEKLAIKAVRLENLVIVVRFLFCMSFSYQSSKRRCAERYFETRGHRWCTAESSAKQAQTGGRPDHGKTRFSCAQFESH